MKKASVDWKVGDRLLIFGKLFLISFVDRTHVEFVLVHPDAAYRTYTYPNSGRKYTYRDNYTGHATFSDYINNTSYMKPAGFMNEPSTHLGEE